MTFLVNATEIGDNPVNLVFLKNKIDLLDFASNYILYLSFVNI